MKKIKSKVLSINISKKKGTKKKPVDNVIVIENFGLKDDAHAEKDSLRQVSILSVLSINKMQQESINIQYGDFGENLTIDKIEIHKFPVETVLEFENGVIMSITQIGKTCHTNCNIYKKIGKCVMPKEGVFAKVIKGGNIHKGEDIYIYVKNNIK